MQYRSPPISRGPSSNTCPRWLSPCTERTSVRIIPCDESRTSLTCAGTIGVLKLGQPQPRSEEHTSELQSLMRISYAVFCLKKKKTQHITYQIITKNKQSA